LAVDDFDAFYAAAAPRLVGQIDALVGSRQEAQDVVQEACLRAWLRWDRLGDYENPEVWVRTVAWRLAVSRRRRVLSHLRAWQRRVAGEDGHEPALEPDALALRAALQKIPAVQRQAIVLHHLCGLSVVEVADEVDVSPNTIKTRLARGRATLARLLTDPSPAPISRPEVPHA
jgi:RNA polymerase sigma-70 factor (ECF subfamily)